MLQSTDSIEDIHFVVNSAPLILQRVAYGVELLKVNISAVCWSQGLMVKLVFGQLALGRPVLCFLLARVCWSPGCGGEAAAGRS